MIAVASEGLFRALYDANHQRVRALLLRMVGPRDADDVAQIAFAKAAQALPAFRGDADASTWLHRIAIHAASDWLRSRAAGEARATVALADGPGADMRAAAPGLDDRDPPPSPEQELAAKDTRDCIRGEIGKLADGHRQVMMLSMLAGMSDDEIADALGISPGNAKVRLHRARQAFRTIIAARCDFYRNELSCRPASADCCEPAPDGANPRR